MKENDGVTAPLRPGFTRISVPVSACAEPIEPEVDRPLVTTLDRVAAPLPLTAAAQEWARQRLAQEAEILHRAPVESDRSEQAGRLMQLAAAHYILGDLRIARQYTEQTVVLAEAAHDERRLMETLLTAARMHQHHGDLDRCIDYFERAVARPNDPVALHGGLRYNVLVSLTEIHLHRKDFERAAAPATAAVQHMRTLHEPGQLHEALLLLGMVHIRRQAWAQALPPIKEALALGPRVGRQAQESNLRYLLVSIYEGLGDLRQAATEFEAILRLLRSTGPSPELMLEHLVHVGLAWFNAGDMARGAPYLERSLALIDAAGNLPLSAVVRGNLGAYALSTNEPRRALTFLERALKDSPPEMRHLSLINLGDACLRLGQERRGTAAFQEALQLAQALGDGEQVRLLTSRLRGRPGADVAETPTP